MGEREEEGEKGREEREEEAIIKHHVCPFPLVSSSCKCYRDSRGGIWELHPSSGVGCTHSGGGAIFGKYSLLVCVRKAALTSRKHHGRPG